MFPVSDIYAECSAITGSDREEVIFGRITDAVELLANKGDFDPLFGVLDIKVQDRFIALPREVEAVLSMNIEGCPTVARDQLFQFHLNGPGEDSTNVKWEWCDRGDSPVYAQPKPSMALTAVCACPEDKNAELWVYGVNDDGEEIRSKVGDDYVDGYRVPVNTVLTADAGAPKFRRITRVRKAVTKGPVTLFAGPYALATYAHNDEEPRFRLVKIFRDAEWVRIAFRRSTFRLTTQTDLIPLHNRQAVVMMVRALKYYNEPGGQAEAEGCEATAVRWLSEEQFTRTPPVVAPLQVHEGTPVLGDDYVD